MLSEIGSNFWIQPDEPQSCDVSVTPEIFGIEGSDYVWLSTGRSAIAMALETIEERDPSIKKLALVPAFTCHTVVEPFLQAGYRVKCLPIESNLQTSGEDILQDVSSVDAGVVLVHRYFGFDTLPGWRETIGRIQAAGVKVIEDRTQCLYSDFGAVDADYSIASIRKWHGVPDGGFIVSKCGNILGKPAESDLELERIKVEASRMKYEYLFEGRGRKEDFLQKYRIAEDKLSEQRRKFRASQVSLQMQRALDVHMLRERRRLNFTHLLEGLQGQQKIRIIFSELPENVTPLYFPIWIEKRQALQKYLAERSIYVPIIWPKADCLPEVCEEANQLYENTLCLPIDQRYGLDDMDRMVECVLHWCAK